MSDEFTKAAKDAVDAAANTEQLKLITAVLQAQQLLNTQQPHQCQHQAPAPQFEARKWLVIGGVVVSVGLVGALFAVAIAVGACCATACLLILRSIWRDYQRGN